MDICFGDNMLCFCLYIEIEILYLFCELFERLKVVYFSRGIYYVEIF